jgi:hypothetical protein
MTVWLNLPLHKLPGIFSVDIYSPDSPAEPVGVTILLKGYRRADVAKWAAHLGSEVTEGEPKPDPVGTMWERTVETVQETGGFRISVRTTVPAKVSADPDPAEFPWRVYAQPQDGARWLVNAFRDRERADRFAQRHPTEYGPLTVEHAEVPGAETAASPQQQVTHHAVMRHGDGGPECGTGRFWEPMTRARKDVTCPDCLASLDGADGGAS